MLVIQSELENVISVLREVKKEPCCNTGGPGFEAPRPTEASAWLKAAVQHFRVILLDQRGTGRSSAITTASLLRIGDARAQAEYLAHFRCAKFAWLPILLAVKYCVRSSAGQAVSCHGRSQFYAAHLQWLRKAIVHAMPVVEGP